MSSTPEFQNICFNSNGIKDSTIVDAVCQTGIDVDSIKKVLSVFATSKPTNLSVQNGKLLVAIKTSVYVCYVDSQDVLRKKECASTSQATFSLAQETDVKYIYANTIVEGVEYDNSGLNLSVTARVKVQYTLARNEQINALTGGENLVCVYREQNLVKCLGVKEGTYPIEEQFELPNVIKEVLHHDATCQITDVQCGVGRVIVDGNLVFSLIALQNEQNSSIIKEVRSIPFRMEVEFDEAMPTMSAILCATRQAVKTDIEVVEEQLKCTVKITSNLTFTVALYEEQTISFTKDAFSKQNHLQLECDKKCFYTPLPTIYANESITVRALVDELPIGVSLLALSCERARVTNFNKLEDGLVVDGVLECVAYFSDAEKAIFAKTIQGAFSKKLNGVVLGGDCDVEVCANVFGANGKIVSAVELDVEAQLCLSIFATRKCELNYIKDVKLGEEKPINTHSISVYIGLEGEELFSLSKRLNESPERVVETNKDLCFPLTGKERIVIFRQLESK